MTAGAQNTDDPNEPKNIAGGLIRPKRLSEKMPNNASPPMSGTISWIRKVIFRGSVENIDAKCETNFEQKVAAKYTEASVGNGLKPENVHDDIKLKRQETTGRQDPVRSKLKESSVRYDMSLFAETEETAPINNTMNADIQLNEGTVHEDISGRRLGFADGGENLPLPRRKRLNNFMSEDHTDVQLEPKRKHQKKTIQKNSVNKEDILSCVLSLEATLSDDEPGYVPSVLTSKSKEMPGGCRDKKQCTPKVTKSRSHNTTQDAELLHVDTENQNGPTSSSPADNWIASDSEGTLEAQEHIVDDVTKEAEKPMEHEEQDRHKEDNKGAGDSEHVGGITIK